MDKEQIALQAKLELARREFYFYCRTKAPGFYKKDRVYLKDLCNELQDFIESDEEVIVIAEPPRHGKSRTGGNLVEWLLGKDKTRKIMTGSYNETLSTMFSKNVRNTIQEEKADLSKPVFSDIFPGITIKRGDGAMNLWSLEGGYNNYLATSPTGTATGFGCNVMIIDDLIKSALEANNADVLEKNWSWFTDTMLSRLEEGGKIIVIMTRWHSNDLAGKILDWCVKEGKKHRYVRMQALNKETGAMLCPEILSYKSYMTKVSAMGADIASANYQQEPIDLKGRLYSQFKTYSGELPDFKAIKNYTDTADTGDDYLCSINYGVTFANEAYILDVLYTKDPMEITEPKTAMMLEKDNVNVANIESNNGGRGFARNVERLLKSNKTKIQWFHQSKNKIARILTNSTWVMEHVYYPEDWHNRWPDFYDSMIKYQREGKNKHDDAQDAITGVAEKAGQESAFSFD